MGQQTVKEIVTKLYIVKNALILGVSGPIGLAQRYQGELESIPTPDFLALCRKWRHEVSTSLSALFWKYTGVECQRAQVVAQATGTRAPLVNAQNQVVVALRVGSDDCLFQFSETCAPEEATDDLPYISIGSGQQNADPFLAFIRRVFWPGKIPNLSGGIFATLWTLTETIQSAPAHVSGPIAIATMQGGVAKLLERGETEEHCQAIDEARKSLRRFREDLEAEDAQG